MSLYFVRHGQTNNNLEGKMNPGDDDDVLTQIGKEQAQKTGKKILQDEIHIEHIISSNLSRARETAQIIAHEILFTGKILQDSRLREQDGGVFKGRKRDDIKAEFNIQTDIEFRKIFKNKVYNQIEDVKDFDARVGEFLRDLGINFGNENILLVGHSGTSRALLRNVQNGDFDYFHFEMPGVKNAEMIDLETFKTS